MAEQEPGSVSTDSHLLRFVLIPAGFVLFVASLILGLLRINEADAGRILIDDVDISTIGLHSCKSQSALPSEAMSLIRLTF